MVMIRPPAYHFWKFLMKNMIPTNSGLIHVPLRTVFAETVTYNYL